MKAPTDTIPLVDFVLESARNLRVAEAAHNYYEAARQKLMKDFFRRLGARLTHELSGWKCAYDTPFFTEKYGAFDFRKPAWKGQYCVRLEAYDHGERMIYGIWRDEDRIAGRPFSPQLLGAIKKGIPSAEVKVRRWYEAQITMRSPAADWRPPSVLWRIHKDPRFLTEVASQLLEVVRVTDKHVAALVKSRAVER